MSTSTYCLSLISTDFLLIFSLYVFIEYAAHHMLTSLGLKGPQRQNSRKMSGCRSHSRYLLSLHTASLLTSFSTRCVRRSCGHQILHNLLGHCCETNLFARHLLSTIHIFQCGFDIMTSSAFADSGQALHSDIQLMLHNARLFNAEGSPLHLVAMQLESDLQEIVLSKMSKKLKRSVGKASIPNSMFSRISLYE